MHGEGSCPLRGFGGQGRIAGASLRVSGECVRSAKKWVSGLYRRLAHAPTRFFAVLQAEDKRMTAVAMHEPSDSNLHSSPFVKQTVGVCGLQKSDPMKAPNQMDADDLQLPELQFVPRQKTRHDRQFCFGIRFGLANPRIDVGIGRPCDELDRVDRFRSGNPDDNTRLVRQDATAQHLHTRDLSGEAADHAESFDDGCHEVIGAERLG